MLGKPLEMASHLSLTTVIFSLLRRYYYIRVTKISRSVTSTCCCYTPSSSRFSIRDRSRSRFVEIESSTSYLFNPPRRLRSILPPSRNSILTFLSDPTIQICIKFHAHTHSCFLFLFTKKENLSELLSLAHARGKNVEILKISNSKSSKVSFFGNGWNFSQTASRMKILFDTGLLSTAVVHKIEYFFFTGADFTAVRVSDFSNRVSRVSPRI